MTASHTAIDSILTEPVRRELAELCRRCGVARLEFFGSAVSGDFAPESSDLDVLVTFKPEQSERAFDAYFELKFGLEELFDRPIDLLTTTSLRNKYFIREIEKNRVVVYEP